MSTSKVVHSALAIVVLILFWLMGYGLSQLVALPPALLGVLLLFIVLLWLGRVPRALAQVSQFLLRHLSFFFIPPLVAAWFYIEQLEGKLWVFLLAIFISTSVSLGITSWLGQRFFTQPKIKSTVDAPE